MKTIKLNGINEIVYYEKLNNGLDVYLYNKDGYHNNFVTFTTKFGSIYNEFVPIDSDDFLKVPNGVAHFLEHKLFVQENDPQPDDFFSNNGALSNAYTTFKNTTYLFSGSNNLKENICYLLDFVQSPYFTKENVESEKGIINEEINMCNDEPADILYETIRRNTLHNNPFKESVIGTSSDVNSVTEELLYKCYNSFYHPSNMFLIVTGSFNPVEILKVIKDNQNMKKFDEFKNIKIKEFTEPDSVVKKEDIIKIGTDIDKFSFNIKMNYNLFNINKRKLNLYLFIIFSILYDDSSLFTEIEKKKGIITSSVSVNLLNVDTHVIISFINQTDRYKELLCDLKDSFNYIMISEEDFNRKKKVLISNEMFSFENIESINEMINDNVIFEGYFEDDSISLIKSLSYDELNDVINCFDFSNSSLVVLEK